MANSVFQIKRTSVSGRAANSTTLSRPGELALNMADGILYSTNGTFIFEVGANNTNVRVSGNSIINRLYANSIYANSSVGTAGQILTSNGSGVYWSTASATGAKLTVDNTAPSSPANNELWWDNSQGSMFVRYGDGDSAQWVENQSSGIIYNSSGAPPLYIQDTQPTVSSGNKYMWVQTGLGDGTDFTIWIEDGT